MDALSGFVQSTFYNIIIQFSFRIFTFVLNAILLRYVTPAFLGIVNVRLMLFYTTVSFCAREPFRRSCLSFLDRKWKSDDRKGWKAYVNVMWLCPIVSVVICIFVGLVWTQFLSRPEETENVQYYEAAVVCYAVALCIETLAEPLFIVGQSLLFVKLKAVIDAVYIFIRQILCASLIIFWPKWSLLAFGGSMIVSSSVYTLLYYCYFYSLIRKQQHGAVRLNLPFNKFSDLLPSYGKHKLDHQLVSLTSSFWVHSCLKQLLTEGERYVMTFLNLLNFADQGVYDVVTNLGSLVARCIFAPLEESAYTYFSYTIKRGKKPSEQDKDEFSEATATFSTLLKLVSLIGLIMIAYGMPYSYLALKVYGGETLSNGTGPKLLRCFSIYVALLAVNGITECFMFAAMKETEVNRHRNWMTGFCVVFLIAATVLTKAFGSVGFILANCINMSCRILYSCKYIRSYYRNSEYGSGPLHSVFPSSRVLFIMFISFMVSTISGLIFCCDGVFNALAHVMVGVVFLVALVWTVCASEAELVDFVDGWIRGKLKD